MKSYKSYQLPTGASGALVLCALTYFVFALAVVLVSFMLGVHLIAFAASLAFGLTLSPWTVTLVVLGVAVVNWLFLFVIKALADS